VKNSLNGYAVDEGVSLMDNLIASLTDVPAPAVATPREIGAKVWRERKTKPEP